MQQSQEMTAEEKSVLGEAVDDSLGVNEESSEALEDTPSQNELPEYAKKKLGMQEKRHKKEMRRLQQQLEEVRSQMGSRPEPAYSSHNGMNPYTSQNENSGAHDQIYAAVERALQIQREQEHRAKEQERLHHVQKQYRALEDHLDRGSEKYEDFDEVVKSDEAPFSAAIRDAALLIPNADETLYHLGKDRDKLKKISELHPLEQAKEVVKMSIALMGGNSKQNKDSSLSKPLSQIKGGNVSNNRQVNENTAVADLRQRMKKNGKHWST